MGDCVICGLSGCKAFLFKPSDKFYFLCLPHFVKYREQDIRVIADWIKKEKELRLR